VLRIGGGGRVGGGGKARQGRRRELGSRGRKGWSGYKRDGVELGGSTVEREWSLPSERCSQ
jgi:hypothetical protein